MLSDLERNFLTRRRLAHLATADAGGLPHVLPVCFAIDSNNIFVTIDEKPKQRGRGPLKRLRNIAENPRVAMVADYYDDADWSRLGWLMVRGRADILAGGAEHTRAQGLLAKRYQQYQTMTLELLPVIALRIAVVTSWGDLTG